jgi:hypothetical protein
VEGDGARLLYSPEDGSLELRLGGPSVTVDGIAGELAFERIASDGVGAVPLWLAPADAIVLGKMIRYILERVKITEPSREALERVLPRVDELGQPAVAADGE